MMKSDLHLAAVSEEKGMGEERPLLVYVKLVIENPCHTWAVLFGQLVVLPEGYPAILSCHDEVIEFQYIAGLRRSTFQPHEKGEPGTPVPREDGEQLRIVQ